MSTRDKFCNSIVRQEIVLLSTTANTGPLQQASRITRSMGSKARPMYHCLFGGKVLSHADCQASNHMRLQLQARARL